METPTAPEDPTNRTDGAERDPRLSTVSLRWTFTPPEYFEQTIEVQRPDYRMTIGSGIVEASIDEETYEATADMRKKVHEELSARFRSAQVCNHRPHQLSSALVVREGERGEFALDATSGKYLVVAMQARLDVLAIDDATGKVLVDTKRERIRKDHAFAELAVQHAGNAVVQALLKSFDEAMNDPGDELTHLYEIRDALCKEFGKDDKARVALGISKPKWRRFGEITCVLPLNQSRHRGNNVGGLRDATQAELDEARNLAGSMIEAYLRSLPS
jgi:hypothetical protein